MERPRVVATPILLAAALGLAVACPPQARAAVISGTVHTPSARGETVRGWHPDLATPKQAVDLAADGVTVDLRW